MIKPEQDEPELHHPKTPCVDASRDCWRAMAGAKISLETEPRNIHRIKRFGGFSARCQRLSQFPTLAVNPCRRPRLAYSSIQLAALGPREYARDNFNLFDGFIVTSGLLELIISPPAILTGDTEAKGGGAISALRSFRLFRVFKLARCVGRRLFCCRRWDTTR